MAYDEALVFRLTTPVSSKVAWTYAVLHSLQGYPNDGGWGTTITVTKQGVLYGTTTNRRAC
jgi:hypothetical protein